LAEYAAVNNLLEEPAFNWWARDLLKLRRQIVNKVKSRYWSTTHKFGIQLPKSVEDAVATVHCVLAHHMDTCQMFNSSMVNGHHSFLSRLLAIRILGDSISSEFKVPHGIEVKLQIKLK